MSDLSEETTFFARHVARDVGDACAIVLGKDVAEVMPAPFEASIVVRHAAGQAPTQQQADRIAMLLRKDRPLTPDRADWHATSIRPYRDAIDPTIQYGSIFGLVAGFLPSRDALERQGA